MVEIHALGQRLTMLMGSHQLKQSSVNYQHVNSCLKRIVLTSSGAVTTCDERLPWWAQEASLMSAALRSASLISAPRASLDCSILALTRSTEGCSMLSISTEVSCCRLWSSMGGSYRRKSGTSRSSGAERSMGGSSSTDVLLLTGVTGAGCNAGLEADGLFPALKGFPDGEVFVTFGLGGCTDLGIWA